MEHTAYKAALQWYLENGVDEALGEQVLDRFAMPEPMPSMMIQPAVASVSASSSSSAAASIPSSGPLLGASDARAEAVKLAKAAGTLEELREAIATFDGIGLKKTATNLVFSDGNPRAPIMLVGEAPGADEDRLGKPFAGENGQLLDKILKSIGLDRAAENPAGSVYIANILNWRPPGNRTPAPGEIEASLPFIERHIQLVNPKVIIMCGGVSAKALMGSGDGISKLRRKWHDYLPQTPELQAGSAPVSAIATFHPSYLLRTPSQKKAVWEDMLMLKKRMEML